MPVTLKSQISVYNIKDYINTRAVSDFLHPDVLQLRILVSLLMRQHGAFKECWRKQVQKQIMLHSYLLMLNFRTQPCQLFISCAGISGDVLRNVVNKVRQRGRGGRTPAGDPRLDPNIEPKKAKRILANR